MYTKEQAIEHLRTSRRFSDTHEIVSEIDPNAVWSEAEIQELCRIAIENYQVRGTLNYRNMPQVHDFYRKVLCHYTGEETPEIQLVDESVFLMERAEIYQFLMEQAYVVSQKRQMKFWMDPMSEQRILSCDGLYHANSVSTSLSFIRHQKMYSRKYGVEHYPNEQTLQNSDDEDIECGVYNDLFFDNCDIRAYTGKHSAYGPISFVFDEKMLTDLDVKVRITKFNPGVNDAFQGRSFPERYYTTLEELQETVRLGEEEYERYLFRRIASFHTTLWNQPYIALDPRYCKYILLERNVDGQAMNRVERVLKRELARAGLDIPVYIRPNQPSLDIHFAVDYDELWRIPEEYLEDEA